MVKVTELIVLHTTKFGENSLVVHTLSKEYGRRGFLVRGVGKKAIMTLFQPLAILEAEIIESSRSTLFTAKDLSLVHHLSGIRNNLFKNTMTMFMSEVIYRSVRDGAKEEGLYEWCEKSILLLDSIRNDFSNFHIRFLLEFSIALGFSPDPEGLMPFVDRHYPIVDRFLKEPFAESMLIPLSGEVRNEIAEDILRYIEFHTETSLNINSLRVLREIFS